MPMPIDVLDVGLNSELPPVLQSAPAAPSRFSFGLIRSSYLNHVPKQTSCPCLSSMFVTKAIR
jgi:hypothetical protein